MATKASERFDTVIVGAGQAGLAAGYHLQRRGERFVILDGGERVGDPWRARWPSLHLYTPAKLDGLPGMRFPATGSSFPDTNAMADYLEAYAKRFELPVRCGVRVERLSREDGRYVLDAGAQRFEAGNVVVASGVMQTPVVPDFAGALDPAITQLHSRDYRSPAQLRDGAVLVVGASHSGADIAFEVAPGRRTILAGPSRGQLPFSVESRRARALAPLFRLLTTRVLTVDTPLGRKLKPEIREHGGPLLRVRSGDLAAAGVERAPVNGPR